MIDKNFILTMASNDDIEAAIAEIDDLSYEDDDGQFVAHLSGKSKDIIIAALNEVMDFRRMINK